MKAATTAASVVIFSKENLIVLLLSLLCGFIMWAVISNHREGYKGIYALYLMLWAGICLTAAFLPHRLFVLGGVMAGYTVFLCLVAPMAEPATAFWLPNLWLMAYGFYIIGYRLATGNFVWRDAIAFTAVSFLAIIFPFMGRIQRIVDGGDVNLDDEQQLDEFIARKNGRFAWICICTSLVGAIAYVVTR